MVQLRLSKTYRIWSILTLAQYFTFQIYHFLRTTKLDYWRRPPKFNWETDWPQNCVKKTTRFKVKGEPFSSFLIISLQILKSKKDKNTELFFTYGHKIQVKLHQLKIWLFCKFPSRIVAFQHSFSGT